MSRITPLRPREVVRKLRRLGYEGPIGGGRHVRMIHRNNRKIIPVPMHGNRDISVGFIRTIIREAEISPQEWNNL